MLPDIQQMSIIELERLLISNVDRIKNVGKGRITTNSIAMALGVHFDPVQAKALQEKIKRVKCLDRKGSYLVFKVEELVEPDNEMIESDPVMKMMSDVFDEIKPISIEKEITLHFTDDNKEYPCKNCLFFDDTTCGKTGKKVDPEGKSCDDFKLSMETIGYNTKSWNKKKR